MINTLVPINSSDVKPSRVFPLPGFKGNFTTHGGFSGGSDIFAPVGTPVVSVTSGKVVFRSTEATAGNSGGNAVQIHGDDGLDYYYAHFVGAPLVQVGDRVIAGKQIGAVGNTGNAKTTASHLHIGIGKGISVGVGSPGGIGENFDAVSLLKSLQSGSRSNNENVINQGATAPQLSYVPGVSGFISANNEGILLNLKKALEAGVDPFVWLGIVSKESGFNPSAKNPTSGACGYAQIYPCIDLPPEKNIEEGLKRLKAFIQACGGDINCALNRYSGGAGQEYISDVLGRGRAIAGANPNLSGVDVGFDPSGGSIGSSAEACPPLIVHIGPLDVPFPDVGCVITKSLNDMQDQLANWWSQWQTEHVPNFTFVILGIILFLAGAAALLSSQVNIVKLAKSASAGKKVAEKETA